MKSQCSLFFFLLLLPLFAASSSGALTGSWKPIKNITDPNIQQIGIFAVTEHDAESQEKLIFDTVTSGESQPVAGTNFRLVLKATNGGVIGNYEALVWEKPWEKVKKLIYFKPLAN